MTTSYAYNTFIFNWVQNYDDQINDLKETMESLKNNVKIYNHLTDDQLNEVVEKLSHDNFELYNYIVVIILDNKCEYEQFVRTSDNRNVLLYSEILTRIQTNPTLSGMPRLFVIQKRLDVLDMDEAENVAQIIEKRKSKMKRESKIYLGSTNTIKANEFSENFLESPFIEVFSRNFRAKVETVPMDKICGGIKTEIIKNYKYKIDIEVGSDETAESNILFGNAICSDVLRDFF